MKKTLLVGLDAACWGYLDPLLARNQLPTLASLMKKGIRGRLSSTMPAHTPTAWASIVTGKNPGKHGVYDHLRHRSASYDFSPTSGKARVGVPFWERLNEHSIKVGLVNIPFTYPPEPVEGFVLTGFGTPHSARDFLYPPGNLQHLEELFGTLEPTFDPSLTESGAWLDLYKAESKHQERLVDIALLLAAQHEVEVLVINLMLLDVANHKVPVMTWVEEAICQLDRDLEKLIEGFDPDNVLAFSDHGSRRVEGTFLLHTWLRDRGYCAQVKRSPREQYAALNWLLVQRAQSKDQPEGRPGKFKRLFLSAIVPRLPARITHSFWESLETEIPFARDYVRFSGELDYDRSRVYLGSSFSGLIYLNVQDREPNGTLSRVERDQLVETIRDELQSIEDPGHGGTLITHIHTPESIYRGAEAGSAPDIILDTYDASCNVMTNFRRGASVGTRKGTFFLEDQKEFGRHAKDGMYLFCGTDFGSGPGPDQGNVMDIPATLLHLYDVPIPNDYDGASLSETLDPDFLTRQPVRYQDGETPTPSNSQNPYSRQQEKEIESHLKALGYLE